jgi:drug/metabolite transporter (DMT)-like permease
VTATRSKLFAGFFALYIFWGSTYLFIRWAVETLPPLGMAGVRFLIAGAILFAIARLRGAEAPRRLHWRTGVYVGALLMGANACVAWSGRRIPSGVAALLVAMTPAWMVTFDWMRGGGRPRAGVVLGLLLGLVGVGVLVGPGGFSGSERIDPLGALVVLAGTVAWAFGSIYQRTAPRPASTPLMSAMQMLCGGAILVAVSLATGQYDGFSLAQVSTRSWIAFVYLIIFGSLFGFSAFVYLLSVTTPARVATYAYVNPVVAVLLGWAFAGEAFTPRMLVAAAIIVGAVAMITTFGGEPSPRTVEEPTVVVEAP